MGHPRRKVEEGSNDLEEVPERLDCFNYTYELRQELKAKKGWRTFCEREKSIVEGVVGEETTTKDNSKNLEEVGISF